MPETLDHHWLTSQLQSMRCSQLAHSEKLGRLAGEISSLRQTVAGELKASRELVHRLLDHMTHRGPTPSPGSTTPPPSHSQTPPLTPGKPASSQRDTLTKQVKALGEWAHLATTIWGMIKAMMVFGPWLVAAWRWLLPWLLALVHGV